MSEMPAVGWYFRPGTEERFTVFEVEPGRYSISCEECPTNFLLDKDRHGVTFGPDGAMSAEQSFNCPKCGKWHRHIRGGVITP
jgi:Zn finger protein HypA/HybF involved in hydrogenase expression